MQLPIHGSARPIKAKYLDEETELFAVWYEFGRHPNGTVDIVSPFGDVFVGVSAEFGRRVCELRDALCAAITEEFGHAE